MKRTGIVFICASIVGAAIAAPAFGQLGLKGGDAQPVIPPGAAGRADGQGPNAEAGPAIRANIAQIMENPRAYVGKNVTVTSRAEEIFTPWAFKLDEQQKNAGGIDSDLLVLGKVPLKAMGFDETWLHQRVTVTGTVRILQAADFRREYGRGVDDALFRRYEGKPVVVAFSMQRGS